MELKKDIAELQKKNQEMYPDGGCSVIDMIERLVVYELGKLVFLGMCGPNGSINEKRELLEEIGRTLRRSRKKGFESVVETLTSLSKMMPDVIKGSDFSDELNPDDVRISPGFPFSETADSIFGNNFENIGSYKDILDKIHRVITLNRCSYTIMDILDRLLMLEIGTKVIAYSGYNEKVIEKYFRIMEKALNVSTENIIKIIFKFGNDLLLEGKNGN